MFVDTPNSLIANVIKDEVELNLDYLIKSQGEDGSWPPTWSWGGENTKKLGRELKLSGKGT